MASHVVHALEVRPAPRTIGHGDEEVDVALGLGMTPGNGPDDAHVVDSVSVSDLGNLIAVLADASESRRLGRWRRRPSARRAMEAYVCRRHEDQRAVGLLVDEHISAWAEPDVFKVARQCQHVAVANPTNAMDLHRSRISKDIPFVQSPIAIHPTIHCPRHVRSPFIE